MNSIVSKIIKYSNKDKAARARKLKNKGVQPDILRERERVAKILARSKKYLFFARYLDSDIPCYC
jgi:hypothetical protein